MARTLGRSEAGGGRALDRLVSKGRLGFRTLVEPALLGFDAEFMVWLSIDPARLSEAGHRLAAHPGTKFLAAATGRFNLVGHMVLPRKSDLFRYTDEVIGNLPGLGASDITLHLLTLKGVDPAGPLPLSEGRGRAPRAPGTPPLTHARAPHIPPYRPAPYPHAPRQARPREIP